MDPVIERIIASPVWHILYPFREGENCYVADDETWKRICPHQQWSEELVPHVAYVQCLFWAMGLDVYAEDCPLKPYRNIETMILILPEKHKVEELAHKLKKAIVLHRLEHSSGNYIHREVYRVGRFPLEPRPA